MIHRIPTVHTGFVLILLCAATACYVLDDFTVRYFNNYGNLRFGLGKVQVNGTYPRYGIDIPTKDDYLIENVQTVRSYTDYTHMSLKLEYTAFSSGPRAIVHFGSAYPGMINVPMNVGRNVVVIPFSYFKDVNVAFSAGLGIGGPLHVHCLEIIVAGSPAANVMLQESVLYTGFGPTPYYLPYSGACLRRKDSPPHRQFVEYWDPEQGISLINKNSRGFRRGGFGITKVPNGINIKYDGLMFQTLVDGSQRIDLSNKILQLSVDRTSFPVPGAAGIDIKIQYHQDSLEDGAPLSSMYTLMVSDSCDEKTFDIPLSAFPDIRYGDVKRIWIYGPVTIHHIKIISNQFSSLMPDSSTDVLVDDLSTWPDPLDHSNMVINLPHSISSEVMLGSGLNSLNYPCYGSGVTLGNGGIKLSKDGFIYEQLASADGIYDLSHASLEIEYSADEQITRGNHKKRRRSNSDDEQTTHGSQRKRRTSNSNDEQITRGNQRKRKTSNSNDEQITRGNQRKRKTSNSAEEQITRKLQVHSVIPDDSGSKYHIQPIEIDLRFIEGNHKKITIDLSKCGPSIAFSIIGYGIVTIHQISLHLSLPGQPQRAEIVDDFADWPLMHDSDPIMTDLASSTPGSVGVQLDQTIIVDVSVPNNCGSDIYDYRQICQNKKPVLKSSIHVINHGVDIHMGGLLIQPLLPGSATSNLIITYSAAYSATRKITFLYVENREISFRDMHVVFSFGESQQIVIKVPSIIAHYVSHIAFVIYGPLTVHRAELVDFAVPIRLLPGQSTPNALLIDDFSNWRVDQDNPDNDLYSLMPNGFGMLTLHNNNQYLIEGFPGKLNIYELYNLSLQITYTLAHNSVCYISLIPETINTTLDGSDPYDAFTLHYKDIDFVAGVHNILKKPLKDLSVGIPASHGLMINGPTQDQVGLNNPLIIHRIEFIANPMYGMPMIPEYINDDPKYHSAGRLVPASLIGATFDKKLRRFRIQLSQRRRRKDLPLKMERGHILRDTYHIGKMDPKNLVQKIIVEFLDEAGQDDGGLTSEFFTLAANEINNPKFALFTANKEANHALHINPESLGHEDQFRHIGRIIGMAIFNDNLMGIRFVPSLYRKLIDKPIPINSELPDLLENNAPMPDISELVSIDKEKHQHFHWLLNTDISNMSEHLALTMSLNQPHHEKMETIDLVKNGRNILVTQSNKNQYVQEYAKWHIIGKVEAQANALRDGVWDVIPRDQLISFNVTELELLIAGTSIIDVDDWERNTSYVNQDDPDNQYSPDDITIKHFWTCVRGWEADQHAKLLTYVTGSPRLPYDGFKHLFPLFKIHRQNPNKFPRASTCFHQLYLSPYTDFDILCHRLSYTITETSQFALA